MHVFVAVYREIRSMYNYKRCSFWFCCFLVRNNR